MSQGGAGQGGLSRRRSAPFFFFFWLPPRSISFLSPKKTHRIVAGPAACCRRRVRTCVCVSVRVCMWWTLIARRAHPSLSKHQRKHSAPHASLLTELRPLLAVRRLLLGVIALAGQGRLQAFHCGCARGVGFAPWGGVFYPTSKESRGEHRLGVCVRAASGHDGEREGVDALLSHSQLPHSAARTWCARCAWCAG